MTAGFNRQIRSANFKMVGCGKVLKPAKQNTFWNVNKIFCKANVINSQFSFCSHIGLSIFSQSKEAETIDEAIDIILTL